MQHHADLLTRDYWQSHKERILAGVVEDVFPYPQQIRFSHQSAAVDAAYSPSYLENLHNE
jgi:isocitrate dehydrogenase kinase/phosphatase